MRPSSVSFFAVALSLLVSPLATTSIAFGATASVTETATGTPAAKLPAKRVSKTKPKRTFIDFSKDDKAVIAKPPSPFDVMLKKSDQDVAAASTPTQIRSRKILAAPAGDSAEPIASFSAVVSSKSKRTPIAKSAAKVAATPAPIAAATPAPQAKPVVDTFAEDELALEVAAPRPKEKPFVGPPESAQKPAPDLAKDFVGPEAPLVIAEASEPSKNFDIAEKKSEFTKPEFTETAPAVSLESPAQAPTVRMDTTAKPAAPETIVIEAAPSLHHATVANATIVKTKNVTPEAQDEDTGTRLSLRTGYLQANYSKFDGRMKDSATSTGLSLARSYPTRWGAIEGRTAFDIFHASDQSVTVENIRMITARAEATYWFTHDRIKPGATMGVGWANYSIRSYRSTSSSNDQDVTVRTHAKSNALALIPAVTTRFEITKELALDIQAEYLGVIGGDSSDATRGLAVTGALGWLF